MQILPLDSFPNLTGAVDLVLGLHKNHMRHRVPTRTRVLALCFICCSAYSLMCYSHSYRDHNYLITSPLHQIYSTKYMKYNDGYTPVSVLTVSTDEEQEPILVQIVSNGNIVEVMPSELLDVDPSITQISTEPTTTTPFPILPWVQHDHKVTLFLQPHHETSTTRLPQLH